MNIQTKDITLKEFVGYIHKLNNKGYETHIEGLGNGNIKLVIQDKYITIV